MQMAKIKQNAQPGDAAGDRRRSTGKHIGAITLATSRRRCRRWIPRTIRIRGWGPWRSTAGSQVSREKAKNLQKEVERGWPLEFRHRLRWIILFMMNHRVSCELLGAEHGEAKRCSDHIGMRLVANPTKVNDRDLKCALGTSPARMRSLKQFNAAYDTSRNPQLTFEVCQRALEGWDASGMVRLGGA